jgi:hypothetical protein
MPIILALRSLRQEDLEFEVRFHMLRPCHKKQRCRINQIAGEDN